MFTVTWNDVTKPKNAEATAYFDGYAWYADSTCGRYATGFNPKTNRSNGGRPGYSGSGETLDAAVKALEDSIMAVHSTVVDKQVEETLAVFKKALN